MRSSYVGIACSVPFRERIATTALTYQDRNGTGTISTADVRIAIRALGLDPPEGELERIARDVDTQSAGAASLSFFLCAVRVRSL